jgi:hypothetical protein
MASKSRQVRAKVRIDSLLRTERLEPEAIEGRVLCGRCPDARDSSAGRIIYYSFFRFDSRDVYILSCNASPGE